MTPLKTEMDFEETTLRHDDCEWYTTCLYKAAKKRLKGFTCTDCENYIPGPGLDIEAHMQGEGPLYPRPTEYGINLRTFNSEVAQKMRDRGMLVEGVRSCPFVPITKEED